MRVEPRGSCCGASWAGYESFFVRAFDPAGRRALWLRQTFLWRARGEPLGSAWLTWFDGERSQVLQARDTQPVAQLRPGLVVAAEARLWEKEGTLQLEGRCPRLTAEEAAAQPEGFVDRAAGNLNERRQGASRDASSIVRWQLAVRPLESPARPLSPSFLYRTPFPRAKTETPVPWGSMSGTVSIGDEPPLELREWPTMLGHNWGSEHAPIWAWTYVPLQEERGEAEGEVSGAPPSGWLELVVRRHAARSGRRW
ncbi:hypothetical protein [Thermoleophilum album]|uniref:Uncharacterized protein n=1 Tax=Thermoleophilum album TaxID=29539 RepID=A0A1H6FUL9_THEAL|nr:hypothetical protein [Thermoleophilum album]SEH14501.1 hypothetical protein SAMN02745716_1652 [Thermoleophilum album]